MTGPSLRSRVLGCFLGGAVGDALGAPVEFLSLPEILSRYGPAGVSGYVEDGGVGRFTDDTQMTLFTAEGLLRARAAGLGPDQSVEAVHRAYLRWLGTQDQTPGEGWLESQPLLARRRAPGNTCLSALRTGRMGTPELPLNDSFGCGGVMRVAPVGFVGAEVFDLGCRVAAVTHGHPAGYLSAGVLAQIVAELTRGVGLEEATTAAADRLHQHAAAELVVEALGRALEAADTRPPTPEVVEALGGGWYGHDALAISVFCALAADDFAHGVCLAVNHSGDSDSTGSITGQILGTLLGVESIPRPWLDGLEGRALIEQVAADFANTFVDGLPPDPTRYPPDPSRRRAGQTG
ncbi:MAG: putative ADP-ribosylglycohydrolase [Acidimicrobiia bacterium]|nr:MAG: putative ADP-ribosylglycohydrolase [Acidimicrobiia bacterium]